MYKFKNFYYMITPRPGKLNDFLLHVSATQTSPHLYANAYPTETEAVAAAEQWIDTVHKTVRDYYRQ